jgi:exonuclease VII large subunit
MLIRISLIVAILAGLAAGVLNFIKVKEKIDIVVTERNDWHAKFDKTDAELTTTKSDLAKTEKELDKTKESLAQKEQERAAAVAKADEQTQKATQLSDKLNITLRERDDARANLAAYEATGYKPEQISALGKQVKDAQEALSVSIDEKKIIQRQLAKAQDQLEVLLGTNAPVVMRADMKGVVLVTDPKWNFVVLNVGEDQEAKLRGEMLVSRDGKLVAKVVITEVQKGRSIANVVPGWQIGEVYEGDIVIPAHPES